MGEIAHWRRHRLGWMDTVKVRIGRSGVEITGDGAPSVVKIEVDRARGVVGVKHDTGVHHVVGGVKGIERRPSTVEEPKDVWTFRAIQHSTAVGIGVGPVRSGLVFDSIRYAVTVKVIGLNIIRWVVFWIRSVKVLASVINTALIRVV